MITGLEDFKTYHAALAFGEEIWTVVRKWSYFERDTLGKQFVRAVDSIAANLSEGLGRYHYRETKNFAYYARGSLFESKTWLTKAHSRGLMTQNEFDTMNQKLDIIGRMLNAYITSLRDKDPDPPTPNT